MCIVVKMIVLITAVQGWPFELTVLFSGPIASCKDIRLASS